MNKPKEINIFSNINDKIWVSNFKYCINFLDLKNNTITSYLFKNGFDVNDLNNVNFISKLKFLERKKAIDQIFKED